MFILILFIFISLSHCLIFYTPFSITSLSSGRQIVWKYGNPASICSIISSRGPATSKTAWTQTWSSSSIVCLHSSKSLNRFRRLKDGMRRSIVVVIARSSLVRGTRKLAAIQTHKSVILVTRLECRTPELLMSLSVIEASDADDTVYNKGEYVTKR